MYAVWDHFPIWTENHGTVRSIGAGGIICLIVLVVIFRKAVFNFLKDKAKINHAPPVVGWLVMLIISYVLLYISNFIQDLTTVFWMGLVGCAIGTVLTWIAENKYGKKEADTDGRA
jgi:cadmium resistance protein CadD (predicted permease)